MVITIRIIIFIINIIIIFISTRIKETFLRELHPTTDLMSETEVCPWTLFLTMSLTLLKGLMPHVPAMLPLLVSDPEMRFVVIVVVISIVIITVLVLIIIISIISIIKTRSRAEATFMDPEFQENIEQYFVENIKVGHTTQKMNF